MQIEDLNVSPIRRCGAFAIPGGCAWRVWAPLAKKVQLELLAPEGSRLIAMMAEEDGYFVCQEPTISAGQRYAFRLDDGPPRPDPCSLWQPEGVHRPSAVLFPHTFTWTDDKWSGVAREDLVFYELHVGTFSAEHTFDGVIPRLRELRELGITAIEIMPVAEFPGERNWGYDGVHLGAPQSTYGGPHGLQRLVDAAHAAGLAVFLDVVYNHMGPEGNYVSEFGPYFSPRYRTPWGNAFNFDSADSDAVRDFILDNVRLWIEDYHLDGLRLDAVHAMFDISPKHILREIKEVADAAAQRQQRHACIVVESLMNDVRMVTSPALGGYGLDAEWSEDFHHAVLAYLTGERSGKYVDFGTVHELSQVLEKTFVLDGRYSRFRKRRWGGTIGSLSGDRFVIGIQNHDHIGNRARGERLSELVSPATNRLAASMMLLSPHLPFIFMGEEYLESNPFLFFCSFGDPTVIENVRSGRRRDYSLEGEIPDPQDASTFERSVLQWNWAHSPIQSGMRRLYHDLLAARKAWAALRNYTHRAVRLLPNETAATTIEFRRCSGAQDTPEAELYIYFNLTPEFQSLQVPPKQQLLFASELEQYGGMRTTCDTAQLHPFECQVFG